MKFILSCIFVAAALLAGCSPTSSDISSQPTPNSQILISGAALANSPSKTGKVSYTVYCNVQYTDTSRSSSEFNSASVTVNGISLSRVYSDGYFQNIGKVMSFAEGDSLEFVVKHPKTGTVKGVAHVPPSIGSITITPGFSQANLPNSETTFKMNWTPAAADYYVVQAVGYNYWQTEQVAGVIYPTRETSATVTLSDTSGSACPYVYLRVLTVDTLVFSGFAESSGFAVSGTYYQASSNMPGVSANKKEAPLTGR